MYQIKQAAVIGAGTMGLGIAGQLANADVKVLLLDVPADGENRNARIGWLEAPSDPRNGRWITHLLPKTDAAAREKTEPGRKAIVPAA